MAKRQVGARTVASLSDEALLALIPTPDGNPALAELYARYGRVAYGLALRILRDSTLAEDAVQDAFLAVWRTAQTFQADRGKPSSWIMTLVHRRAVDLVRREERRRTPEPTDNDVTSPPTDEEVALRERRLAVQEALKQLPRDQREALELAYYGGYTQSELSEHLSVPLGTVKSRMFAGLRSLAELLAESGLEPELTR
jgi:RNA polymerase sigma factor (sigma-70 family)